MRFLKRRFVSGFSACVSGSIQPPDGNAAAACRVSCHM